MSTGSILSILAYPQYGYHLVYHTGLSLVHCSYLSVGLLQPHSTRRCYRLGCLMDLSSFSDFMLRKDVYPIYSIRRGITDKIYFYRPGYYYYGLQGYISHDQSTILYANYLSSNLHRLQVL